MVGWGGAMLVMDRKWPLNPERKASSSSSSSSLLPLSASSEFPVMQRWPGHLLSSVDGTYSPTHTQTDRHTHTHIYIHIHIHTNSSLATAPHFHREGECWFLENEERKSRRLKQSGWCLCWFAQGVCVHSSGSCGWMWMHQWKEKVCAERQQERGKRVWRGIPHPSCCGVVTIVIWRPDHHAELGE